MLTRNTTTRLVLFLLLTTTASAQQSAETIADYNAAGIAAQKAGNCEEALQHYSEAIKLDPKDLTAQMNSGICYMVLEKWEEALGRFKIAVALRPDNGMVHFALADALRRTGRTLAYLKVHLRTVMDDKLSANGIEFESIMRKRSRWLGRN